MRTQTAVKNKYHFDAVQAHTLKIGADSLYAFNSTIALKAGVSLERTWNGKVESRIVNTNLETPSIRGNSVGLYLGVRITPQSIKGLEFDIGATGKLGDCHGVIGMLKARYLF